MDLDREIDGILREYHLKLTDVGKSSIRTSIKLLYGPKPTKEEIREVLDNTMICYFDTKVQVERNNNDNTIESD